MKTILPFILLIILALPAAAQVSSDRIGFISSSEVVADKGFQLETGYMNSSLGYTSPYYATSGNVLFRKGASQIHEFRVGYYYGASKMKELHHYEWFSLGVKLKVADYEKLKISSIGTWGFDLRTLGSSYGPTYYLELKVPAEYHFTENLSLQTELRQSVGKVQADVESVQFAGVPKQSDINIAIKQKISPNVYILPGVLNQFILSKRGNNGEKPEWSELLYASIAAEARVGKFMAFDLGAILPIYTGKDQVDPSDGFAIKGGFTYYLPTSSRKGI